MNTEKLVTFIKSRGYTNVKVDVVGNGFRVCCRSQEYYIEHHYKFPISELPSQPDVSEKYLNLLKAFPSLYDEAKI